MAANGAHIWSLVGGPQPSCSEETILGIFRRNQIRAHGGKAAYLVQSSFVVSHHRRSSLSQKQMLKDREIKYLKISWHV